MADVETILMVMRKSTVEYFPASPSPISRLIFKGSAGTGHFCVTTHRLAFIKRWLWKLPYPKTVQDLDRFLKSYGGWASSKSNIVAMRVNGRGTAAPTVADGVSALTDVAEMVLSGFQDLPGGFTSNHGSTLSIKTRSPNEVVTFVFDGITDADSARRVLEAGLYKGPQFGS